jgi:hypothetical protein
MSPTYEDPDDGLEAIRSFAERCVRDAGSAPTFAAPAAATFAASMPNGREVADAMADGGWVRVGDVEYEIELEAWADARAPIDAAMGAAITPVLPFWIGAFDNADGAATADPSRVAVAGRLFDAWADEDQPQWYDAATDPLPAGFRAD